MISKEPYIEKRISDTSKKSAVRRLQERLQKEVADKDYDRYSGGDWWQLSYEEEEVFQIKLEIMPLLVAVFSAYEAVVDIAHNDFHRDQELCEAVRTELGLTKGESSLKEFQDFAKKFEIFNRESTAFYYKNEAWLHRTGHLDYTDEIKSKPNLISCLKKAPANRFLCTCTNSEDKGGYYWVVREVTDEIVVDSNDRTILDEEPIIAIVHESIAEQLTDEVYEELTNADLKSGPWCSTFLVKEPLNK